MIKGLVFPSIITEKDKVEAGKSAYKKYGYILDEQTSIAYAATLKQSETILDQDGSVVLVAKNHPGLTSSEIKHRIGKTVDLPDSIKKMQEKAIQNKIITPNCEIIKNHIKNFF